MNSPHAFSWTGDGRSIVFSQLELVDTARALGDLYRIDVDSGEVTRLTRSARLASPDVHPNGRMVVPCNAARAEPAGDGRYRVGHGDWTDEFAERTQWGPAHGRLMGRVHRDSIQSIHIARSRPAVRGRTGGATLDRPIARWRACRNGM